MAGTALKQAMTGEKPVKDMSERQAKGALSEALGKLSNTERRLEVSRDSMKNTAGAVVNLIELNGALFLASMAEGYLGAERMKLGGLDLRAPIGMAMQGYGLFQMLSGKKGGEHALSLGNGVTGSWLASVGQSAGRTVRSRGLAAAAPPLYPSLQGAPYPHPAYAAPPPTYAAWPPPAPQGQLAGAPWPAAPQREVLLSPAPAEPPPVTLTPESPEHEPPNRFVRAQAR